MSRNLAAVGELRVDLLELLEALDPLDVLCSAPGWLPQPFRGAAELARAPAAPVPKETAFAWRGAVLEFLADGVDRLPQTRSWEERIRTWVLRLDSGRARVLHQGDRADHTRMLSRPEGTRLFFGPLTHATAASQDALTFDLGGAAHLRAREWFLARAATADDVSAAVSGVLKESWAFAPVSPEDLYLKVIYDYFAATLTALDRETDDNPLLDVLTVFQEEAYHYAKGVLRRYGGVFLSDVVGLGKTYIALALLKHLQDRYGHHAVVVAPPAVCGTWEDLAAEHRVELVTVSLGKLDDLERREFESREVLVVDESHHFRNMGTRRYATLHRWLRPPREASARQVILLSATPQNNEPEDVLHQLQLFPDNYTRLPYRGESLEAWFKAVRQQKADLRDLLQHVLVRRTRTFVQANYPGATIRRVTPSGEVEQVPIRFPRRVSGPEQCLRYVLDAGPEGMVLYDRVLEGLGRMTYPLHSLARFLRDDLELEGPELLALRRGGGTLRGIYKCLLLKRLESSLHAFTRSIERLAARLRNALRELDADVVTVLGSPSEAADEEPDPDAVRIGAEAFDAPRLRAELLADASELEGLMDRVEELRAGPDAKLSRLEQFLTSRPPGRHKTLIFTQFADTATWLMDQLGQRFGRTALVTGSTPGKLGIARRFAPRANRVQVDDEIDLLVSTDALSEGVNLQDGDTLVNYDLHWNPVRLIQRAGRIDRIGSENEEIWIASFLPERRLEAGLGLEQVLRRRIDEFLRVFGEDSRVLPSEEIPDLAAVESAFTGAALAAADASDDLDGLSRHVNRILALRRQDPVRFDRIAAMRSGRRAWSRAETPGVVACRIGWYWNFWSVEPGPELEPLQDLDGLDRFHEHARAPVGVPSRRIDAGAVAEAARADFLPRAEQFRKQRIQPARTPAEDFVLERLASYRTGSPVTQRPLVDAIDRWVRSGSAKALVQREGRRWKKQNLAPVAVFHELRQLYRRFPGQDEELGDPELVGLVLPSDP